MSIGNLKDNGNKGNNVPYQLANLQLLEAIKNAIIAIPVGADYETRTTYFKAIAAGLGYSIGDILVRYDIMSMPTGAVITTVWFNQTLQTVIAPPAPADVIPFAPPTSITVSNPFNLEATQVLIKALLTTIDGDTSNLDVLLSTRASEATLAAGIGALLAILGPKATSADMATIVAALGPKATSADIATIIAALGPKATSADIATIVAALAPSATAANQTTEIARLTSILAQLDVALSTRASEATLATRATEATLATMLTLAGFQARINTFGQKTMALSTPVVLASDQSSIPVTIPIITAGQTYSANIVGLVVGAVPTDIFTIIGSATKKINVQKIVISATRTANSHNDLLLIKRSTANTLGTSTTPTVIPHDSTNAAGTAVVRAYTANPTLGVAVGTMRSEKQFINTVGGADTSSVVEWRNDIDNAQPLAILNGVAETLALNLNGVTIAGNNFDIYIVWTET